MTCRCHCPFWEGSYCVANCKKVPFIYSFSGNSAASAPISTFICLWAIYIVPGSVYIFPPAEKGDRSWEYINRSQRHECGNWDWGPGIPFLGIFVSKFPYFLFAALTSESYRKVIKFRRIRIWYSVTGTLLLDELSLHTVPLTIELLGL